MGRSAHGSGPNIQHVRTVRLRPLYDCADMCGRTRTDPGDMRARAACRCSLPGFDPTRWNPAAHPDAAAEAEAKAAEMVAIAAKQRVPLDFDLDQDGCPWGWVVSEFAGSVLAYTSRRDPDSVKRDRNIRLDARVMRDPEVPERLLELVQRLESYEDAAYRLYHEVVNSS